MQVYLAGAIEHAPDRGLVWRDQLTTFLVRMLGHTVYDPAKDEKKSLSEDERLNFRSWKTSQPEQFRAVIRKIIDYDLSILSNTDYVVCYWDQYAMYGGGTQGELTFARHMRIPVYLVRALPLDQISGWILGCCEEVFCSFEELESFLKAKYYA